MHNRLRMVIAVAVIALVAGIGLGLAAADASGSDTIFGVSGPKGDESAVAPKRSDGMSSGMHR